MSRDWTQEELHTASEVMKQNGYTGFEEFCHALEQKQPVEFDFQERNRKELVKDISEILEEKAQYMKMPTCAYQIGSYTIAKDGTLTWDADRRRTGDGSPSHINHPASGSCSTRCGVFLEKARGRFSVPI